MLLQVVSDTKKLTKKDFPSEWDAYMDTLHTEPCKYNSLLEDLVKWKRVEEVDELKKAVDDAD